MTRTHDTTSQVAVMQHTCYVFFGSCFGNNQKTCHVKSWQIFRKTIDFCQISAGLMIKLSWTARAWAVILQQNLMGECCEADLKWVLFSHEYSMIAIWVWVNRHCPDLSFFTDNLTLILNYYSVASTWDSLSESFKDSPECNFSWSIF